MFRSHDEFETVDDGYTVTDEDAASRGFLDLLTRLFPAPAPRPAPEAIVAEIVDDAPCGRHSTGEVVEDTAPGRGRHFRFADQYPVLTDQGEPAGADDLRPLLFTMRAGA